MTIQRSKSYYPLNDCLPLTKDKLFNMPQRFLGGEVAQNWAAPYFLEHYIEYHKFEYVIELGTSYGALSLYLLNMAESMEFIFHTFEINKEIDYYKREFGGVGYWMDKVLQIADYSKSFTADVFSQETINIITPFINKFKTFIFCDNGDKPREFNMLAPLLKKGDCIATHDWETGIFQYQIQPSIDRYGLEVDEPWANSNLQLKNLIRPFRKV